MQIRDQMLLEPGMVYLNSAAATPMTRETHKIAVDIETNKATLGITFLEERDLLQDFRSFQSSIAKLIGGRKEGVTFQTATAPGLHLFADIISPSLHRGQKVVITDQEFVTNSYVWQVLCRRYGLDLKVVPLRGTEFSSQDWERVIDDTTAIVAVSHVQFKYGYRSDLRFLADLVHDVGGKLVVDGIQSVGIVPMDVERDGVDFMAAGGYKWMMAPFGTGFSYVNSSLIKEYDTHHVGWFSASNYNELEHNMFLQAEDARKFQATYYPKMLAMKNAVDTLNSIGVHQCYEHSLRLQNYLLERLDSVSFELLSSMDPSARSGIVSLRIEGATSDIVKYLNAMDVYTSFRGEGLRVSPHCFNTEEDIERLVSALQSWSHANL